MAEMVDALSKRIASLEAGDEVMDPVSLGSYTTLKSRIRLASVNFVKETLVGLPGIPTEEELLRLQQVVIPIMGRKSFQFGTKKSHSCVHCTNTVCVQYTTGLCILCNRLHSFLMSIFFLCKGSQGRSLKTGSRRKAQI